MRKKEFITYEFGMVDNNYFVIEIYATAKKGIFESIMGKALKALGEKDDNEKDEVTEINIREDYFPKLDYFLNKQYAIILKDIKTDKNLKNFRIITRNITEAYVNRVNKDNDWKIKVTIEGTYSNE